MKVMHHWRHYVDWPLSTSSCILFVVLSMWISLIQKENMFWQSKIALNMESCAATQCGRYWWPDVFYLHRVSCMNWIRWAAVNYYSYLNCREIWGHIYIRDPPLTFFPDLKIVHFVLTSRNNCGSCASYDSKWRWLRGTYDGWSFTSAR